MTETILWDVDGTLLNFLKSENAAIKECFHHFGLPECTDEMVAVYSVINEGYWKQLERGEITRAFLFPERFRRYFAARGLDIDPAEFNTDYLNGLAQGYAFMPHCRELLEALHGKYKVFIVTNGDAFAQRSRIERSGLAHLFDGVFISEELGCSKPEKGFYDKVFEIVGQEYRACSLMVGDSLTSDMQGGRNAGIPTCLYGRREKADARCDYVIEDLLELLPLLEAQ